MHMISPSMHIPASTALTIFIVYFVLQKNYRIPCWCPPLLAPGGICPLPDATGCELKKVAVHM